VIHRPASSWLVEFGWSARGWAGVANSPVVGVEPDKADSGYRVSPADYPIRRRCYNHGSKNCGPGWRCHQRWRPFRGPANTTPDIPASCNRSGPLSRGALASVPCKGELPASAQRAQLSPPAAEGSRIPLSHSMRRRQLALGEARRAADEIADRARRQSELGQEPDGGTGRDHVGEVLLGMGGDQYQW
jgi:hypothetical protein